MSPRTTRLVAIGLAAILILGVLAAVAAPVLAEPASVGAPVHDVRFRTGGIGSVGRKWTNGALPADRTVEAGRAANEPDTRDQVKGSAAVARSLPTRERRGRRPVARRPDRPGPEAVGLSTAGPRPGSEAARPSNAKSATGLRSG